MADKAVTTQEMKIELLFIDGDTRTITLKYPKTTAKKQDILDLQNIILNGDGETLLIGDKNGSQFQKITKASRVNTTTTTLDIG